jgi:hypothetical protein
MTSPTGNGIFSAKLALIGGAPTGKKGLRSAVGAGPRACHLNSVQFYESELSEDMRPGPGDMRSHPGERLSEDISVPI